MAEHNIIGKLGEEIAEKYLKKTNFSIIYKNFTCKYGEIDIIAKKDNYICFIEVKSKKIKNWDQIKDLAFRPENNLTKDKRNRLYKSIKLYLITNKLKEEDINIKTAALIVFINQEMKQAKIKYYDFLNLI